MASSVPVCDICDRRNLSKPSVVWCSQCDEILCIDCKEHHSLSKLSQKHSTVPITEYMTLPANIRQLKEHCSEHNEKYQLFCIQHNCPCCRICALDRHKKCEDMTALDRIMKNLKDGDLFNETEHLITEILETINEIRKNRTNHLSSVQQQRKTIEKEILAIRTKINNHLDQAQEALMNELTELESNVQKQTNDFLSSLIAQKNQLNDFETTMSTIKQHATEFQAFLFINGIQHDVAAIDKSIHKLIEKDTIKNTTLSCEIDNTVQHFPTNVLTFGKIIVKNEPFEITISRRKNKQAQIMVAATTTMSIENISLKLQQTINTQVKNTTGSVLLPDGRMLFCNGGDLVRLINKDETRDFNEGKVSSPACDITHIEDTNTIAVTSGNLRWIRIIDMGRGKIRKTIYVKSHCYGIAYRNNTLIYCAWRKGLRLINLNDESESDILVGHMSDWSYVATYKDKLYYTNRDTHTVTSCDLHGITQWTFEDESILKLPLGITVDNDGNVYVVGCNSCNVIVISPDGQHARQLLGKEDGLDYPQALHFDKSTNRLLIANNEDVAYLFQVKPIVV